MDRSLMAEHLLVRACLGLPVSRTPVWAMRQAGRWDPEFRRLRQNRSFYEFADDVEAAAEVSLLPRRFGVDAIILFYDITTLPQRLGWSFSFEPGRGPMTEQVPSTLAHLAPLRQPATPDRFRVELELLDRVLQRLRDELPVIAFAGAPFTVACYCIGAGKDTMLATEYARSQPTVWSNLLQLLADRTAEFLALMQDAGAHVIQLFDSWAGALAEEPYVQWAQRYHQQIFQSLRGPRILYVRECPYLELMVRSGAEVVSLGVRHDLREARQRFPNVTFQGNVDASLMSQATVEEVRRATRACLEAGQGHRHILNLNQGMPKDARPENFQAFVETARQWRAASC